MGFLLSGAPVPREALSRYLHISTMLAQWVNTEALVLGTGESGYGGTLHCGIKWKSFWAETCE